ncbi:MAG: HNH nuclease family protein [Nitrospirae bacterium]|nr:HNH nuclease family protein [Nitrospirota bacterium]
MRHNRIGKQVKPDKSGSARSVEEIVRELRQSVRPSGDYREQSLKIHGLICAKCGREFEDRDRQLLTVHHRDGNHKNNPPDGSNWENLCIYCHEDEHSRGRLADYLRADDARRKGSS